MSADIAGRGKAEYSSLFAILSLSVTILLDLVLIPRMGIRGAALASSAAYLFNTALVAIALKYLLKVSLKSLLVPSRVELASYWRVWVYCKGILLRLAFPQP